MLSLVVFRSCCYITSSKIKRYVARKFRPCQRSRKSLDFGREDLSDGDVDSEGS